MSTHRETGAEGTLKLRYLFKESASGHTDSTDEARLEASADGKSVVLVTYSDSNNQFSPSSPARETHTLISVPELETLIRQHGKRIK